MDQETALDKIAKLLAKAESTDSAPEAEALIAAAQRLMTSHSIEQAMLDQARAARGEAREGFKQIRLCEERNTPLIKAKRQLVQWLADINNCYVVLGHKRRYMEVTGHESDVDMLQHLFASLLIQMQRAMGQAEARGEVVGALAGWRVSFAHGYVRTVGLRLLDAKNARVREANATSTGTALVLRNRAQLSEEHALGIYGSVGKGRRIPTNDRNQFGRASGTQAGQRADLGGERIGANNRKEIGS